MCEQVVCEQVVCEQVVRGQVVCEQVVCEQVVCEQVVCEEAGGGQQEEEEQTAAGGSAQPKTRTPHKDVGKNQIPSSHHEEPLRELVAYVPQILTALLQSLFESEQHVSILTQIAISNPCVRSCLITVRHQRLKLSLVEPARLHTHIYIILHNNVA